MLKYLLVRACIPARFFPIFPFQTLFLFFPHFCYLTPGTQSYISVTDQNTKLLDLQAKSTPWRGWGAQRVPAFQWNFLKSIIFIRSCIKDSCSASGFKLPTSLGAVILLYSPPNQMSDYAFTTDYIKSSRHFLLYEHFTNYYLFSTKVIDTYFLL